MQKEEVRMQNEDPVRARAAVYQTNWTALGRRPGNLRPRKYRSNCLPGTRHSSPAGRDRYSFMILSANSLVRILRSLTPLILAAFRKHGSLDVTSVTKCRFLFPFLHSCLCPDFCILTSAFLLFEAFGPQSRNLRPRLCRSLPNMPCVPVPEFLLPACVRRLCRGLEWLFVR